MKAAGIDSQMFKAHSVRGASMTAAASAFVPLLTIMSLADLSWGGSRGGGGLGVRSNPQLTSKTCKNIK